MTKNKKIGWALILGPILTLVVILFVYAIAQFVISAVMQASIPETPINYNVDEIGLSSTLSDQGTEATTIKIINAILGLLGILAVIGIFPGIIIGIYFLSKKEPDELVAILTGPQYQGLSPEQIKYISSWSWGMFFGQVVWLLGNRLFVWALPFIGVIVFSILGIILPLFNLGAYTFMMLSAINGILGLLSFVLWIYLSIKGRQLSWEKGWASFDTFKNRQKILVWIILLFIAVMFALQMTFIYYVSNQIENYDNSDINDNLRQQCMQQCFNTKQNEELDKCLQKCTLIID